MEPRGVGTGWLCLAVLCSAAALVLKKEEPGPQNTTRHEDVLQPTEHPTEDPTTTTGDVDELTTWPTVTPTPPWTGDLVTTLVPTQAGATGNKTQKASTVAVRYWSPAIFVVVALLVLFFTYRRTKGEGSRDPAASTSDSSDLGALDHPPLQDTTPIIPTPQERKRPETHPAPEHTETTFCEPDPPTPQPDTHRAAGGPPCSGEPGAN